MPIYLAEHYVPDVDASAAHRESATISHALADTRRGRVVATVLVIGDDTVLHLIESDAETASSLIELLKNSGSEVDRITSCALLAANR